MSMSPDSDIDGSQGFTPAEGGQPDAQASPTTVEATGDQEVAERVRSKQMIDALVSLNDELGGKLVTMIPSSSDKPDNVAVLLNSFTPGNDGKVVIYGVDPEKGAFAVDGYTGMLLAKIIAPDRVRLREEDRNLNLEGATMRGIVHRGKNPLQAVSSEGEQQAWGRAFDASRVKAEEYLAREREQKEVLARKDRAQEGVLSFINKASAPSANQPGSSPTSPGPMA